MTTPDAAENLPPENADGIPDIAWVDALDAPQPPYPWPATREVMRDLARLLDDRGVLLRPVDGEVRLRDPDNRLTAGDRELVRHYSGALAQWLTDPDSLPSGREPIQVDPTRCPQCDADLRDTASVAYRSDHRGDLLERCVPCGATWPWGEPDRKF